MRLTNQEFALIRPLQWVLCEYGNVVYNTPVDQTSTRLFWIDFMRYVFAPKYGTQCGITSINDFDTTQPVLLSEDMNLKLPTILETAMYFSNNQRFPPQLFVLKGINRTVVLISVIALYLVFALTHWYYSSAAAHIRPTISSLTTVLNGLLVAKVI